MKEIYVNKYFQKNYLTTGSQYGSCYIFDNCPTEFLAYAKQSLKATSGKVKACNIYLTRAYEEKLERTLNKCDSIFQQQLIARDFFDTLVMLETMKVLGIEETQSGLTKDALMTQLNDFLSGDVNAARKHHVECADKHQIEEEVRLHGKMELNVFLEDTNNKYVQQSINTYFLCPGVISVKLFTDMKKLPTYSTTGGAFICGHDYQTLDVNQFVSVKEKSPSHEKN